MNNTIIILLLFLIIIGIISIIVLSSQDQTPKIIKVYNELPPPAIVESRHWGYTWRPWWRKYGGVPGFYKKQIV